MRVDRALSSVPTENIYAFESQLALCTGWALERKFIGGECGQSDLDNVGIYVTLEDGLEDIQLV